MSIDSQQFTMVLCTSVYSNCSSCNKTVSMLPHITNSTNASSHAICTFIVVTKVDVFYAISMPQFCCQSTGSPLTSCLGCRLRAQAFWTYCPLSPKQTTLLCFQYLFSAVAFNHMQCIMLSTIHKNPHISDTTVYFIITSFYPDLIYKLLEINNPSFHQQRPKQFPVILSVLNLRP